MQRATTARSFELELEHEHGNMSRAGYHNSVGVEIFLLLAAGEKNGKRNEPRTYCKIEVYVFLAIKSTYI